MKPREMIDVLENPEAPALTGHDEGGEELLVMLAHMYHADGEIDAGELAQLSRVSGVTDGIQQRLAELKEKPLNIPKLAELFPEAKDRDDIVTLAEHAVFGDGKVDHSEWDIVEKLVEGLGVKRD
ncbi:MAG: hypothetical protein AAGF12_00525 [Myxococcota bacterium]